MPEPSKRRLPQPVRDVPWVELRRHASTVFLMLQAGWNTLSPHERDEARQLITKFKGRPGNLTKPEARRLGRLAAKAARAAADERARRSSR